MPSLDQRTGPPQMVHYLRFHKDVGLGCPQFKISPYILKGPQRFWEDAQTRTLQKFQGKGKAAPSKAGVVSQ